ncbi:hypothetical protein [Granulicella sibirica]|uniref:Uncharacterized protein n=1 Tax=Granulicella sibirica TaxID=2479048 RepID=A0A4V1L5B4_9BACT|nr:hypothetical protein [Granulicella sibirica]RXH55174.1 hypothetical protein GRAN_4278 [Granulicella sibirica]
MAKELARRTAGLAVRPGSALKKAAKKSPGKKAAKKSPGKKAAKKAPGKKSPGKKSAKHTAGDPRHLEQGSGPALEHAFHHLQRASAVISLLEQESGGDLRMLLEEGIKSYRVATDSEPSNALDLLRAAEHLSMAGLYAARISHRLDATPPPPEELERLLRKAAHHLDSLELPDLEGFEARLPAMAEELLNRAEAALDHDPHLSWELAMAAESLCAALEA